MPAWLNPAGGVRYHARALLGGRAWRPFHAALASWLEEFRPRAGRAVLVGPSAGYSLPDAFLRSFASVLVLEPDPLAGFVLLRRLRALGIRDLRHERRDLLIEPLVSGGPGLPEFLRAEPETTLIFANVLGQARFLGPETEFERFKAGFRERIVPLLDSRAWLSFHDRLSGALSPTFSAPYRTPERLSDSAVLRELYPVVPARGSLELFDHLTRDFFPSALPHVYFDWQIARGRYHLIEGVAVSR